MAQKLTDAVIWIGQYDVSGDHNMVRLPESVEPLKATTFGSGVTTHKNIAGLKTAGCEGSGVLSYGADSIEDVLRSKFAVAEVPNSFMAEGGQAGELAWFFKSLLTEYTPVGGDVGALHAFTFKAAASKSPLVRGQVMAAKTARTSSSNSGTPVQVGAVTAAQRVYAALHVFAVSGTNPTLDVTVKSDDGVGFASPTTRITFAQLAAAGAEFKSAAGAITDDFWRIDWTIGGTDPSFTFAVVLGIL